MATAPSLAVVKAAKSEAKYGPPKREEVKVEEWSHAELRSTGNGLLWSRGEEVARAKKSVVTMAGPRFGLFFLSWLVSIVLIALSRLALLTCSC